MDRLKIAIFFGLIILACKQKDKKLADLIQFNFDAEVIRNTYSVCIKLNLKLDKSLSNITSLLVQFDNGTGEYQDKELISLGSNSQEVNVSKLWKFAQPQVLNFRAKVSLNEEKHIEKKKIIKIPLLDPLFDGALQAKAITTQHPAFSWQPVPLARSYLVQVSKDRNFKTIFEAEEITQTNYQIKAKFRWNAYYCVRVRPKNKQFPSQFSPFFAFAYVDIPMVAINGASFQMGRSKLIDWTTGYDLHTVTLDDYKMDKYEVSVKYYALFLNTQNPVKHYRKEMASSKCGIIFEDNLFKVKRGREDYPMVYVDHTDAQAFAEWRGMRLPTEAEWEYAAKGKQYRRFAFPESIKAKAPIGLHKKKLMKVYSFPEGKNAQGLHHLSGNVWEWVQDWYSPNYYRDSENFINPPGPSQGKTKVLRGGAISFEEVKGYVTYRDYDYPTSFSPYKGFRCAVSVNIVSN